MRGFLRDHGPSVYAALAILFAWLYGHFEIGFESFFGAVLAGSLPGAAMAMLVIGAVALVSPR